MQSKYHVGQLDQRIEQRRATSTPDGMGGNTKTFTTVATFWALVRPMTTFEVVQSQRIEQHANYLVVVRADAAWLPDDVVRWEGRDLNVRGIKITPRSPWLELECELGAAI
jgi:SPP1 family predicted phage head-tail adaptor